MQNFWRIWIVAGVLAALFTPMKSEARYGSETDTNATALDYIENNRRRARENQLSDEQLQLMEDAKEMTANLRHPIDPSKPKPMVLEGDDMYYDQTTGDVYARGDVRVTSIDYRRVETEEARGNLKKEEIQVDGKAHMLQMTPGQARITMDGYRLVYHYGKQTGTMENGRGKIDKYYVYGRRFEFYPDKVYVLDGWQTRCNAKNPDYRVSGDLIEIYPEHEVLIYQAKFWLKDKILFTKKYHRIDISPGAEQMPQFPRFGYDNDDGFWITQKFSISPWRRMEAFADVRYYSKHGFRNVYGLEWSNAGNSAKLHHGYFEDSNNNWIKKEPTFIYQYSHQLGKLPFSYSLNFEGGRWTNKGITSTHTYYGVTLSPYTLKLGGSYSWRLSMSVSYG
ncbi:MAG: LPS-assembly protein LptD, partial [Schwartzia sp.]|nr:LPS-assembly protein LptD [Schwartzia sp. (in: firmicutes)]